MSNLETVRNGHQVISDALIFVSKRNMLRHVYDDSSDTFSMFANIKEDSEVTKEDLEEIIELALSVGLEDAIKEKYDEFYRY